jgi:hypothetical protein
MDYYKHYMRLINTAKSRTIIEEYYETHHILPSSIGGLDNSDNLVKLTGREHYIAHKLLYKHYKKFGTPDEASKMAFAYVMMSRFNPKTNRARKDLKLSSREYEILRKANSEASSIMMKQKWHDEEFKELMIEKIRETNSSEEYRKNMSNAIKNAYEKDPPISNRISIGSKKTWEQDNGSRSKATSKRFKNIPKSEEHKKKIGRKNYIQIQHLETLKITRVDKEKFGPGLEYDTSTWAKQFKTKKEEKFKCKYCDVSTTKGNLTRWHNEKCKHAPEEIKLQRNIMKPQKTGTCKYCNFEGRLSEINSYHNEFCKEAPDNVKKPRKGTGYKHKNKAKKKICEHCNKEIAPHIYSRFHGNKCKHKG